jgi:hypothetical protein
MSMYEDDSEHRLIRPVEAHGEKVEVLKWREPTAGDLAEIGISFEFNVHGLPQPKLTVATFNNLISILAAIPPSSVRQIAAADWYVIVAKMSRFFVSEPSDEAKRSMEAMQGSAWWQAGYDRRA